MNLDDCRFHIFFYVIINQMTRLSKYIFSQALIAIFVTASVLTFIVWLVQSMRFVDISANKGISSFMFLKMVLYLLPNLIIIVLPIAVLIGILFIYNKLLNDHEIHALQASGVSYWQLAKPSLGAALIYTFILYGFNFYLLPVSYRNFRALELNLRQEIAADFLQPGQFVTHKKFTAYAREKNKEGKYQSILIYDEADPLKSISYLAKEGIIISDKGETQIILFKGNRQETDVKMGKPSILYFNQYTIKMNNKKVIEKDRPIKPYERFINDLLNPSETFLSPQVRQQFYSAAHKRILTPLYAMSFAGLALSSILLGQYKRRGNWKKILLACIIAVFIQVFNLILLNLYKYSKVAIPIAYLNVIGTIFVSFLLLIQREQINRFFCKVESK